MCARLEQERPQEQWMRVNDRPLHREEVSVMGSFIKEDWFKERKKEAKEAVKAQKLAEKKRQASVKKVITLQPGQYESPPFMESDST